jgi:hypothetical protein
MSRFDVDGKRFVSDSLDGETIVMDTVSGRLFLLEQGAAVLWNGVTGGWTRDALIAAIETRYGYAERAAAEAFLARLADFGLFTENDEPRESEIPETPVQWPAVLGEFLVTQYDDMTRIITMDPIHDIDPKRGWPFDGRD